MVKVPVYSNILHQYTWFIALYTWFIALYTMFSSIYHVHCSIYHVHCSIYMVHCSIYHVFLEKNEFAKLCITRDSNSRSHADRKAALTTAPRALIQDCVCARYQYVRFCIAGSTSPGGWCRTSGAGPAAPPAPAMTSPAWAFQFT